MLPRNGDAITRNPAPLLLLVLVSMVQPAALNMYVPAMAAMSRDLGTSAANIQLTLSLFLVATAVAQLVIGPLSDIYGRRPILLWGLWLFLLGTAVCVAAPDITVLIAGRIIQAVGACAGLALGRAIVRDLHETEAAASMIGYVTMGLALAPLVAPIMGGLLYEAAGWRWIFVLLGLFGAGVLAYTAMRLGETHAPDGGDRVVQRTWREMKALLRIRLFWLYCLTLGSLTMAFFAFVAGGAFVAERVFNLSPSSYGVWFVLVVVGYIVGNFVTGRYSARIGLMRMIVAGNAISLTGVALSVALNYALGSVPAALFVPMLLVGLGNGFALPTTVAGAVSVRPQLAGTASGLAGAFQISGGAVASFAVGILVDTEALPGIWCVQGPMFVGALCGLLFALTLRSADTAG